MMLNSKTFAMIALLATTAHSLRAEDTPTQTPAASAEELRLAQEEFISQVKQKWNHTVQQLSEIDRTKLIVQSTPFAAALSQIHPVAPGMMAIQNAPNVAAQYQRLMREWNRYQLLVFLESVKQFAMNLIQPPELLALVYSLVDASKPLMQVMGQILLPNGEQSTKSVSQFFSDWQEDEHDAERAKLVRQE